jgi:hypothetical protein
LLAARGRVVAKSAGAFQAKQRIHMARPNYAFAKRQRDLLKKQKKEEKKRRKIADQAQGPEASQGTTTDADATDPGGKSPDAQGG